MTIRQNRAKAEKLQLLTNYMTDNIFAIQVHCFAAGLHVLDII